MHDSRPAAVQEFSGEHLFPFPESGNRRSPGLRPRSSYCFTPAQKPKTHGIPAGSQKYGKRVFLFYAGPGARPKSGPGRRSPGLLLRASFCFTPAQKAETHGIPAGSKKYGKRVFSFLRRAGGTPKIRDGPEVAGPPAKDFLKDSQIPQAVLVLLTRPCCTPDTTSGVCAINTDRYK